MKSSHVEPEQMRRHPVELAKFWRRRRLIIWPRSIQNVMRDEKVMHVIERESEAHHETTDLRRIRRVGLKRTRLDFSKRRELIYVLFVLSHSTVRPTRIELQRFYLPKYREWRGRAF